MRDMTIWVDSLSDDVSKRKLRSILRHLYDYSPWWSTVRIDADIDHQPYELTLSDGMRWRARLRCHSLYRAPTHEALCRGYGVPLPAWRADSSGYHAEVLRPRTGDAFLDGLLGTMAALSFVHHPQVVVTFYDPAR